MLGDVHQLHWRELLEAIRKSGFRNAVLLSLLILSEGAMIFQIIKVFFLLFAVVSFSLNAQESSLEYSIHPQEKNGKLSLFVSLKFQESDKGITEILLPSSWAGQDELYLEIENLHCISPQAVIEDDDRNPIAISLEWQNFPDHWSLANSFGNQNQKQELFLPISTFLHAVYVGSKRLVFFFLLTL